MTNNPNPKRKRGNTIATRTRKRGTTIPTRMRKRGTTAHVPVPRSRVGLGCDHLPPELGKAAADIKNCEQDVLKLLQEVAG